MAAKSRLDRVLVDQGLVPDEKSALALILAGRVRVDGKRKDKPGCLISEEALVEVRPLRRYVSRGGDKLAGGLAAFKLDPSGMICIDIGASTGGFTDCLLQQRAKRVYAVDVGYGVLDWKLRNDARVVVLERTNARYLTRDEIPDELDLAVMDASFISLELLLPPIISLFGHEIRVVALVKPQFELPRGMVPGGGIVESDTLRLEAVEKVKACAADLGLVCRGLVPAPIRGTKGNQEYLLLLRGRHHTEDINKGE